MIPLDKLISSDGYRAIMHCPACGDECGLHITKIHVNAGGSITVIDHSGTRCSVGDSNGRGTVITICYACELCGDVTSVTQRFHKGSVFFDSTMIHSNNNQEEGDWAGHKDIWRN